MAIPATTENPAAVEPVAQVDPAPTTTPEAVKPEAQTPPWGSDDEFDPKKAWDLIQNLRAQKNDPTAAKKLAELEKFKTDAEDAQRTEIEKVQARADEAEAKLQVRDAEALRTEVAFANKLTSSQAKRLVGTTREELEADAVEMIADLSIPPTPAVPDTTGQGAVGKPIGGVGQLTQADIDKMSADAIVQAQADGKLNTLMGITSP